ncbi:MAG: spore maturation protein [Gammaproteobacteria bacterium]|nr:spore maturation protein [Gammaproteobacteria bacterium]MDH5613654.1 spore maturation protein [Gammaproteobacteria bacterium]
MLARIWTGFFLAAFLSAMFQWLVNDQSQIFSQIVTSTFDMARLSAEIALGLIGILALWLGFFRIAEKAGLINVLARLLAPLFKRLMPQVPEGHPALGSVTMNLAANFLGLDNAATPMGLKAMRDLQTLNPDSDTASNAQILFLVLNTSSVTLLPVTIFLFRAQQGSADPTAVFIPILLATSASTITGLLAVAWFQRLKIFDAVILTYFAGFAILMALFVTYLGSLSATLLSEKSSLFGNLILFGVIILFLTAGIFKRINTYDAFIEGAKEGFDVAVKLIPFLVGMLVAIGVLRASGVLDLALVGVEWTFTLMGFNTDFVQALPTALMKPLSGSGARAMMLETMATHGVDSFPAMVSSVIQGSTETTFYVLAVYFGSVGIKHVRHAITCGLLADLAGIVTAITVSYWFFYN